MTTLLEKAIKAVRKLPESRQDELAELLFMASAETPLQVTDDERKAIEEGLADADADADAGRFARGEEINAIFAKHRVA